MQAREKVEKSRNTLFFSNDLWSGWSKSRLAKAAGAEPSGHMRDENLHAVVAQSTFPSQNATNTSTPEHFWKLRCSKSERHCACQSQNVQNTPTPEHFLAVEMFTKVRATVARSTCRSQNVQSTHRRRSTFGS